MYQTCIGHTEGAVVPIYVLLSDSALYLLTTKYGQKKFKKEGTVKYSELDYISVSNVIRNASHDYQCNNMHAINCAEVF